MAVDSDNWTGRGPDRGGRLLSPERSFKIVRVLAPFVVMVSLIQIAAIVRDGDDLVRLVEPMVLALIMSLVGLNAHARLSRGGSDK